VTYTELVGRDLTPAMLGRIVEVRRDSRGIPSVTVGVLETYEAHGEGYSNWIHLAGVSSAVNVRWAHDAPLDGSQTRTFLWHA